MTTNIDLSELAIDRDVPAVATQRHLLTRYLIPLTLIVGYLSLMAWASRDALLPPRSVTVVPVVSSTAAVRMAGKPLFQAAGWIEPRPTPIRVAALAPGVVQALLVVEDQYVERGDPIAELVKDDARLVHERALADLELRRAEVDVAAAALAAADTRLKQPVHLEAALGEAAASLAKIETALANLPFEVRRAAADRDVLRKVHAGKLAAKGVVAGVEVDVAEGKVESAQALVDELRGRNESLRRERTALSQRRDALRTQLELLADETKAQAEAVAQIRAAKARVERARVVVAEAKLQLDRMTIAAPVDGRIFRLIAHPGARIGGGITPMQGHDASTVVTMYQPDMLQVRVDVRFEDIPQVQVDQPVEIDNPALKSPLVGRVLFVSSEADIQKNTLQVKVEIPDPPTVFKPEMLVDVTFLAPVRIDAAAGQPQPLKIFVPPRLIRQDEAGSFVWVADQSEGLARRRLVQTGVVRADGLTEITGGLTVSSRIITGGTDGLRDGDRIHVAR